MPQPNQYSISYKYKHNNAIRRLTDKGIAPEFMYPSNVWVSLHSVTDEDITAIGLAIPANDFKVYKYKSQ